MNSTTYNAPTLTTQQRLYLSANAPFYYFPQRNIFSFLPDFWLSILAPVFAYWVWSALFYILDTMQWAWAEKYRLHDSDEAKSRNLVSPSRVLAAVIFQQALQTAGGYYWLDPDAPTGEAVDHLGAMAKLLTQLYSMFRGALGDAATRDILDNHGDVILYSVYWWIDPVARFLFGMFIIDTWQYFLHRAMHTNTFLYKTLHSVHHRLYVPYAYGALYNHPLEGFILDTSGAIFAEIIAKMNTREAMLLFVISTLKTVDDHCGYKIPFDPLQFFSPNNADYHDIHHQQIGIKSNYSQPFFIHWDIILGTRMSRKDIELRKKKYSQKTE